MIPGRSFHPSLMFASNSGAYLSESSVCAWPYPQTSGNYDNAYNDYTFSPAFQLASFLLTFLVLLVKLVINKFHYK